MENRSLAFKISVIILVITVSFFAIEDKISSNNPFLQLKNLPAARFDIVRDSSMNVWITMNRELYGYSSGELKKYPGEGLEFIKLWGFDALYAVYQRERIYSPGASEKEKLKRPEEGSSIFVLAVMEKGKLKELEESFRIFNFFHTSGGDRLLVTERGEIRLNGVVVKQLDMSKADRDKLDVNTIKFSEEFPGSVWIWSTNSRVHENVFKNNFLLLKTGKIYETACADIGLAGVNDIIEPAEGIVYIGQYYNEYKCAKVDYKINNNRLEIKKDLDFEEKSFIPILHYRAQGGKLWALSITPKNNIAKNSLNEMYYFSEGRPVKYASGAGGNTPFLSDREYFMLEDNGFIWIAKGFGHGLNLLLPGGQVNTYDVNHGIRVANAKQIIKLPDGKILLVNSKTGRLNSEDIFQVLKKDSAGILSSSSAEKVYDEFPAYGEIKTDSKGRCYWEADRFRSGTLRRFDGNNTVDIINAYDFRKEKEEEKPELKDCNFQYFGIDSDDNIWLVYGRISGGNNSKYAVIFKNDGKYEFEDFYKIFLKKNRANKEFKIQFLDRSASLICLLPDTVLIQGRPSVLTAGSREYSVFREITAYREDGSGANSIKTFKQLTEPECFLGGFNKTPEGKIYLTTWSGFTEKDCYVFDNGDWKKSEVFYPNRKLEEENNYLKTASAVFNNDKIGRIIECSPGIAVFTSGTAGLFFKKWDYFLKFKDIPGNYYAGGDLLNGAFIDIHGNLWISRSSFQSSGKVWIRIKKDDIPKVTEEYKTEAAIQKDTAPGERIYSGKTTEIKYPAAAETVEVKEEKKVLAGSPALKVKKAVKVFDRKIIENGPEESVPLKEVITGERIASTQLTEIKYVVKDFEGNFKKFISDDQKDVREAEKFFLDYGSESGKYLETKKGSILDEKIAWKLEALLSRLK